MNEIKIYKVLFGVVKESIFSLAFYLKNGLSFIGTLIQILIPYLILLYLDVKPVQNPFLFVVPIILYYVSYVLKKTYLTYFNRTVDNIPIPTKRYTKEDEDGTITVNKEEVQDMLLYLCDLENELIKLGKL